MKKMFAALLSMPPMMCPTSTVSAVIWSSFSMPLMRCGAAGQGMNSALAPRSAGISPIASSCMIPFASRSTRLIVFTKGTLGSSHSVPLPSK